MRLPADAWIVSRPLPFVVRGIARLEKFALDIRTHRPFIPASASRLRSLFREPLLGAVSGVFVPSASSLQHSFCANPIISLFLSLFLSLSCSLPLVPCRVRWK